MIVHLMMDGRGGRAVAGHHAKERHLVEIRERYIVVNHDLGRQIHDRAVAVHVDAAGKTERPMEKKRGHCTLFQKVECTLFPRPSFDQSRLQVPFNLAATDYSKSLLHPEYTPKPHRPDDKQSTHLRVASDVKPAPLYEATPLARIGGAQF